MKQKNIVKLTAATFAIIGAGTILFYSAAEVTLEANAGRVESIPTSYQVSNSLETSLPMSKIEGEDSGNVNYSVSIDSLNAATPTDMDLTMEEAAEVGRGYLSSIYGLSLEGAHVYMMYYPGTETFPRAFWCGDVLFQKEQTPESTRWTYMIDAVTGELFNICYGRKLDTNVPLGYDAALEKDYSVYAELAKKKTAECELINGSVDRVEYNCQGYSANDPTITVNVISKDGEIINMSFSRYDQTFLGLITDTSRKITESALENANGEVVNMNFELHQ
ncbi:MAG: hypothetical protein NC429_15215 [Lachnospiraceae bacterium]|nr:hypothetical protein [Lachnospiraceae bacterium]